MNNCLPTGSFATWAVTDFKDSLTSTLNADQRTEIAQLYFYFYAVTSRGWSEIRGSVQKWLHLNGNRAASAYIGTDHGITDPVALRDMRDDGLSVRLMKNYRGVFHPKVVWLKRIDGSCVWAGSNNITHDGLVTNIEFSVSITFKIIPREMRRWADGIHDGSVELTDDNLHSYEDQRRTFERGRMESGSTTFTWRERSAGPLQGSPAVQPGDLVIQVMPRETGSDGNQIQLPIEAARSFFGLLGSKDVALMERGSSASSQLTMSLFPNHTVRLVISQLQYRDRPCVIVFHRIASDVYEFGIIRESIDPVQYRYLLDKECTRQTRQGSRRWGIV